MALAYPSFRTVEPLSPYLPENLRRGLVLYLWMNEGSGNRVYDLSGNGNHGTIYGATWTRLASGKNALYFDGVDDYVLVPVSPSLDITDAITFVLMINIPQRATGIKGILSRGTWWGPWLVEINYDYNLFVFRLGRSSTEYTSMDINYLNLYSMWNHFVLTGVSGGYMRIYLNGAKVAERAFPYSIGTYGDSVYIGRHGWGNPVNSVIGYLLIYNRALSDAEIRTLYDLHRGLFAG